MTRRDTPSRSAKCPTCDSPAPHLHPAMQHEGEVQPCKDAWHDLPSSCKYPDCLCDHPTNCLELPL